MNKKVLMICTSMRKGKTELLADEFIRGARKAGHDVEKINLIHKNIQFCKGCLVCQDIKSGHCVMRDDADAIVNQMRKADIIVFATPIYFYEMNGQMKTLLDRSNPLYPIDYEFRDIYLITAAAENEKTAMDNAIKGLEGWIECFDKAQLKGVVYGNGSEESEPATMFHTALMDAFHMGESI